MDCRKKKVVTHQILKNHYNETFKNQKNPKKNSPLCICYPECQLIEMDKQTHNHSQFMSSGSLAISESSNSRVSLGKKQALEYFQKRLLSKIGKI